MFKSKGLIFIITLSFFIVLMVYFVFLLSPVADGSLAKKISIKSGVGVNEIAGILKEENLIRSRAAFKVYSFITGSAHRLKPGSYALSSELSLSGIVRKLVNGPEEINFLIPEGRSLADIESDLMRLGLIGKGELINFSLAQINSDFKFLDGKRTLEGFLFPDTYRILPDSSPEIILRKLLNNFEGKALPILHGNLGEGGENLNYSDLIVASLIEREIPFKDERRLVAGILKKRLQIDMPLQVDSTVVYLKCERRFDNCPPLTRNDFGVKSLYNTYFYKGLPPAPISNPGLDAILAAINPQKSDYLYYLSDPKTRRTIFAKTLEEHEKNRKRYLSE